MKVFIIAMVLAAVSCARLENNYLPPSGALQSGGGPGLAPPSRPGFGTGAGGAPFAAQVSAGGFRPSGGTPSSGGQSGQNVAILSQTNVNNGDGSYSWSFEAENGIKAEERGELKNKGSEAEAQSAAGSYSYTAPDGQVISVTYVADENGFRPVGDHLPTSPPIPPEILQSLQQNAAEESQASAGGGFPSSPSAATGYPSSPSGGAGSGNQYVPPQRPSGNGGFSPQSGYRY